MAQNRPLDQPMPPESSWIRYQLDLRGIKQEAVAQKARRTAQFVSMVINRKRKSKFVEAALAEALGYDSWKNLWAAAFVNAERRAG